MRLVGKKMNSVLMGGLIILLKRGFSDRDLKGDFSAGGTLVRSETVICSMWEGLFLCL